MSQFGRMYLLAVSVFMAAGAVRCLIVIAVGAEGYTVLGAPAGLVALVGTGSPRPAVSCIVIAGLLLLGSVYGISTASFGPRLPFRRLVLTLIAAGLIVRGILLPIVAALRPELLRGLRGQCQSVNGFVLFTSAICLMVGGGYVIGACWPARVSHPSVANAPRLP